MRAHNALVISTYLLSLPSSIYFHIYHITTQNNIVLYSMAFNMTILTLSSISIFVITHTTSLEYLKPFFYLAKSSKLNKVALLSYAFNRLSKYSALLFYLTRMQINGLTSPLKMCLPDHRFRL